MRILHQVAAAGQLASTPVLSDPAAVATLALAALTAGLVVVTYLQGRLARRTLDLSIRPLLVNPGHELADDGLDHVLFRGTRTPLGRGPAGALFYQGAGPGPFYLSVAFETSVLESLPSSMPGLSRASLGRFLHREHSYLWGRLSGLTCPFGWASRGLSVPRTSGGRWIASRW